MRYYKQFHHWPYVHILALCFGCVCLSLTVVWHDPSAKAGMLVCAIVSLLAAWILWKGRRHYLEIDQDWIVHRGFKRWRLRKSDVVRIEHGRKDWVNDHDPYLKVHALGREYHVEDGFLINEQRVEELAMAMQGTADSFRL